MSSKPFHGCPCAVALPHAFYPLALPSQMPSGLLHVAIDAFHDALHSWGPLYVPPLMTRVMQDQELHPETAADAQTDEAYTLPREVAGHCSYSLPPDLYQYERRVLL